MLTGDTRVDVMIAVSNVTVDLLVEVLTVIMSKIATNIAVDVLVDINVNSLAAVVTVLKLALPSPSKVSIPFC